MKTQGGPISWSSKRQTTVATTEAEYMALSATCQEVLWLRSLAAEIDSTYISKPTIIHCDNKGAVDLASTAGFRPRTKHIDIRHHFLGDHIENKDIVMQYTQTEQMIADSLTKPLCGSKFKFCKDNFAIV